MPYFAKPSWQYMEQKPTNKLICCQGHDFLFVIVGSVQIRESDIIFTNGFDPVIGDGDLPRRIVSLWICITMCMF
jgi:hypothetical protein